MFYRNTFLLVIAVTLSIGVLQSPRRVANAQTVDRAQESRQSIVELLTQFRSAAKNADQAQYFGCLAKDGIFFGTDGNERWTFESLKTFLEPYFARGVGWEHQVKQRQVYVGPNDQLGWFEEHSFRENVGPMRTTGVVKKTDEGWKIVQYHVAIVIPNEAVEEVVAAIRQVEKETDTKNEGESEAAVMSAEQRLQVEESFEYVWKKIKDSYWDAALGGVDWQAAYDELKPKLDDSRTHDDALRVLNALVGRMKVSHFSIIPSEAYEELGHSDEKGSRGGVCGLDVRIVDDQVMVVGVTPKSPADQQKVRTGWIVETIDEINVPEKLAEIQKEFDGNPHARVILASAANSRLRGRVGDEIKISFRDGNNELVERILELVPPRGEKVQFGHIPEFRVWVDVDSFDHEIGYFRFNAFMNPVQVMTAYNTFMTDNRDSQGVIIDVRGNGGGSGAIAIGMIGWLLPGEKASLGKVILRGNELDMIVRPRPETFKKPVVVLIDEMSVSAAEFFASGIKDLTEARLIGTQTAGAVLGSQIERLPTGDGFQYAAANFISVRTGKSLEGIGVAPHQTVEPDREMLLQGKDPAIQAAIEWIQKEN